MVRIDGEVLIERPPEAVFDAVADERNLYDPRIRHAELLTSEPIGEGTRFRSVSTSMGRPVEMVVEITRYERPRRLASTSRTSTIDIRSTLTFEPAGDATRMRWTSELEPHGLLVFLTPVLGPLGRRQMKRIWGGLKRRLEGEARALQPPSPT